MSQISVLIAGTPKTTAVVAEALFANENTKIVGVLCPNPKPVGRKQILTPCELEQWAVSKSIPVFHVEKSSFQSPAFYAALPECDLLIVADFGFLLPPLMLEWPKFGAYNLHPSLLPKWRGAAPVPFTLLFGETETGITVIRMNAKFDQGGVLFTIPSSIGPTETPDELLLRLFSLGAAELSARLQTLLSSSVPIQPQPAESPTPLTRKFSREDGFIPFLTLKAAMNGVQLPRVQNHRVRLLDTYKLPLTATSLHHMIRALQPWPGTFTTLPNGKRLKILRSELTKHDLHPKLKLLTIQLEGKTPAGFSIQQFPELAE